MPKEHKLVTKFKESHLRDTETVFAWSDGYIGNMMGQGDDKQHNGVLFVTNERVVFYSKSLFDEVIESIPLSNINSIERKAGLMKHTTQIHSSGKSIEFKALDKAKSEHVISEIEANQKKQTTTIEQQPSQRESSAEDDVFTKIKKLAELKEMGIVSEDEFTEKKAQLMSEI